MPDSQLFLIDAHALCYRSFYGIRGLSTRKGQATNAVFGVVNALRKILRDHKPEYFAFCFDVGKKTHRHEKYAEYKVHRPKTPDELISQIPLIKDIIAAYNLPVYELEGFEADDVIATITKNIDKKGIEVVIVSDDKDMFQLVNEKVKIYSIQRDKILGLKEVEEILGFEPKHIPDYIGLAGDKTDNIPGVPGIGKVSAQNLINRYGDIDNIFSHLDEIESPRVKGCLEGQKKDAVFSRDLAVLDVNVPLDLKLSAMKVREPDHKKLFALFNDLELRKFAEEFSDKVHEQSDIIVKRIKTEKDSKGLILKISAKKCFAFLLKAAEETEEEAGALEMFVSLGGDEVFCVEGGQIRFFNGILSDTNIQKITYDIKEALKVAKKNECDISGKIFDIMLAGYLLSPSRTGNDVDSLLWEYLKTSVPDRKSQEHVVSKFYALYGALEKQLKEKDLLKLFEEIEIPLAHVLFLMESQGVKIDENVLKKLSKESDKRINSLISEVYELAGEEFNLNSPKQLSHILFEKLKLPVIKKTKTGFSTNEEVLTKLADKHALPESILEYRKLAKLKSTYIDALPRLIDPDTGRIHSIFNQTGTETGRLSSNNPNLQNIPIRTEFGRQIRKAFVPSTDKHSIIAADYSQIELRILAHLSEDENLIKAFKKGEDVHKFTASLIFDVKEEDVKPKMRDTAKRVNFGIIYGMSAFGLAKDLSILQREAQDFIDKYFLRYPQVKSFMGEQIKLCEEQGFVTTLLNRRRYIPEINSENMAVRQFAQRQAINTPVQGSAADVMKLAMIKIQNEIEKHKMQSKMIITVHDEIVFNVLNKEEDAIVGLIRKNMEHTLSLAVPIDVIIKKGSNWLEMKRVKSK